MSGEEILFIVSTTDEGACGVLAAQSEAETFARQIMNEECVNQKLDHTEVEEVSDGWCSLIIQHPKTDFIVSVDTAPMRGETFNP